MCILLKCLQFQSDKIIEPFATSVKAVLVSHQNEKLKKMTSKRKFQPVLTSHCDENI